MTSEDTILSNLVHLPNTLIEAIISKAGPTSFLDVPQLKRFEFSYKMTVSRIADAMLEVACEDAWRKAVFLLPDGDVLATDPVNLGKLEEGVDCLLVCPPMACCLRPGLDADDAAVEDAVERAKVMLDESFDRARKHRRG